MVSSVKTCKVCNQTGVPFYPNRRVCKQCYAKNIQNNYAQSEKGKAIRHAARKRYDKTAKGVIFKKTYYANNPQAREASTIRKGCWNFIKKGRAGVRFSKNIGCTAEEYRAYLESQFVLNMSWSNYGTLWHIDHILPLNCFNLLDADQFAAACHYTNTRPLYKIENLKRPRKSHPNMKIVPLHYITSKDEHIMYNVFDFIPENMVASDIDEE